MFNRILAGIDGSKNSLVASEYGIYLSKLLKRPVVGVHIVDVRLIEGAFFEDIAGALGFSEYDNLTEKVKEALDQKGKVLLDIFAKECREKGGDCSIAQVFGIPHKELINLADPEDLLIIGKHGQHKNLTQLIFGTTADYIVKHSKCPVLLTDEIFKPIENITVFSQKEEVINFGLEFAKGLGLENIVLINSKKEDYSEEKLNIDYVDLPLDCKDSIESYIEETQVDVLITDKGNYKLQTKVNLLLK
ncbi:MAG: universal stress protein [Hydrogenothermus sp.]|nr:MAG: universal stress protein [Hydrogenothermus sp.]